MQVDPRLSPGCPQVVPARFQRSKLNYDKLLSNLAFNFNLRPSNKAAAVRDAGGALAAAAAGIPLGGAVQLHLALTPLL